MKKYYGAKLLLATPKTRGEYNDFRGWTIPEGEDPSDAGMMVQYQDGYISWSPLAQFNASYRPIDAMTFGLAIEAMRNGHRVARSGWNGKGMFIYLVPAASYPAQRGAAKAWAGEDAMIPYGAYIAMKTVDGTVIPWLASQTDILAEDWGLITDQ